MSLVIRDQTGVVKDVLEGTKEAPPVQSKIIDPSKLVPTGSTMLNLALSDNPYGGYLLGTLVNIIGDSSAGKTFLCWNMLAEICHLNLFPQHKLIYRDVESKLQIDLHKLFGQKIDLVKQDFETKLIEDWYKKIRENITASIPFIDCLDSLDAISTEEDQKDKELKKEYPIKPLLLKSLLERLWGQISDSESLVVIVSQTRQNLDALTAKFVPKRRAGGEALHFYCLHEIWLSITGHVKRGPEGSRKEVGVEIRARVKKNHLTGKLRDANFNIYYDYGVDDIGSMIDWLISEGYWSKTGQKISTKLDWLPSNNRADLISHIESNNLERKLREYTGAAWLESEKEVASNRKNKYE